MEQYERSVKRATILADFERQLRAALADDDELRVRKLTTRFLTPHPWLAEDVYRKVYLRGRMRALEARIRSYDRLLAGQDPRAVRYLAEGWRRQREEAAAALRDLAATATLDTPAWPEIVARLQVLVREGDGRGGMKE